ncbi:hypothetical protein NC653_008399 [Populus alba x Populus x berolinensis]|uniref:Uncharacterized protein n=1 Tax=Populus alba x Populus x berolinensis TaxID=444605 RepID=A0AAD6R7I9_9ROSI|nr:hypothetical protein NC653_008399 [Populus alba x Populus x berolinensis]
MRIWWASSLFVISKYSMMSSKMTSTSFPDSKNHLKHMSH